jgi:hypothetical protein
MPNRHARRAAAAKARLPGYMQRVITATDALRLEPGKLGHTYVGHDDDCAWETGRCTCTPDITRPVGTRLLRVGPHGEVEETPLS